MMERKMNKYFITADRGDFIREKVRNKYNKTIYFKTKKDAEKYIRKFFGGYGWLNYSPKIKERKKL